MKKILLLASIALIFSCNNQKKEKKEIVETKTETKVENSAYGTQNYAVVWKWTTTDKQLMDDNVVAISNELINLWKKGVVENAYYDSNAKIDKFEYYPNITFFLKAESYESAEVILNKLTIVKKGIAVYTIYPVGTLWLKRNANKIDAKRITLSYVAVWTRNENEKPNDELIISQSDAVLKLWNEGVIENVYFDIEGTQKANNKTDFVFFVNTNSKEEAIQICENLPFTKNNIATYKLFPVGVFWMGEYEK